MNEFKSLLTFILKIVEKTTVDTEDIKSERHILAYIYD